MREIKFRVWDKEECLMLDSSWVIATKITDAKKDRYIPLQFTGLHDKNGKEIYELMEINEKYRVEYKAPSYVLTDISTGDIISLDNSKLNQYEITREYSPI